MKKILLLGLALSPIALLASGEGAETDYDIIQRTVNFIIFAGILWYLLADKIKAFFADRSLSVQAELDKVQDTLKASQSKIDSANKQLEEAKVLAAEIVENAKTDVDSIKQKVAATVDAEIAQLEKNFDEKINIEVRKAKKEVVAEVLEELFNSGDVELTQEELSNIVLKKVA
ncbi:ATP synthase, F0 complex, b subunit [Malaciobacter marinus]|uniref:ATP synthase subunit b n=1 Tax=Malaciobacter marinus TaxID=505249 RepID=A0A347TMD1_9BACT|nr:MULTISPECIES: F0F1 ATP synthase subunit B [Malaciobacter]AXX87759.1 ATP synthase, F0 complex, b subunit [Malaciobacter marinus]PHO12441.1 F0F1 ATP synthase subunit B [Malaciobacter marinus]PHO16549.1 F0F1 ATP synthase subunit B [Malaciobacter marinus]RYA22950.1 F0F1 ATP synthase subunit B [Malaciobacter halophilus]